MFFNSHLVKRTSLKMKEHTQMYQYDWTSALESRKEKQRLRSQMVEKGDEAANKEVNTDYNSVKDE